MSSLNKAINNALSEGDGAGKGTSLNSAITDVLTEQKDYPREVINERINRDESHLKPVDVANLTPLQKKQLRSISDVLFPIIGPEARKYSIHKDSRLDDDIEVHFPMPKDGITMTSVNLNQIAKIRFFYINIGKTKIVVTFMS